MEKKELTAADVWAMFAETDKQIKEVSLQMQETDRRMQETDRRMQETDRKMKETDRQMKETDRKMQESDRRMQESERKMDKLFEKTDLKINKLFEKTDLKINKLTDKLGGIDDNIGFHAEQYFQNSLAKSLSFGGEKFDFMLPNLRPKGKCEDMEFDIVLVNGASIAIIEVKNRIHPKFIKDFAEERIAAFRGLFPVYKDFKAYLGVAGFSFSEEVLSQAKEFGIGVIRQAGDSVEMDAGELRAY